MNVCIAGMRSLRGTFVVRQEIVSRALHESGFDMTRLTCGMAAGTDMAAWIFALRESIPVDEFRPNYKAHPSRVAPLIRNVAMADHADALVAVWDGDSHGTCHVIGEFRKRGKPVHIHYIAREIDRISATIDDENNGRQVSRDNH